MKNPTHLFIDLKMSLIEEWNLINTILASSFQVRCFNGIAT